MEENPGRARRENCKVDYAQLYMDLSEFLTLSEIMFLSVGCTSRIRFIATAMYHIEILISYLDLTRDRQWHLLSVDPVYRSKSRKWTAARICSRSSGTKILSRRLMHRQLLVPHCMGMAAMIKHHAYSTAKGPQLMSVQSSEAGTDLHVTKRTGVGAQWPREGRLAGRNKSMWSSSVSIGRF